MSKFYLNFFLFLLIFAQAAFPFGALFAEEGIAVSGEQLEVAPSGEESSTGEPQEESAAEEAPETLIEEHVMGAEVDSPLETSDDVQSSEENDTQREENPVPVNEEDVAAGNSAEPSGNESGGETVSAIPLTEENAEEQTLAQATPSVSEGAATSGPTIRSGTAVALANILNIVNTNLVNSDGSIIFLNLLHHPPGGIDLRSGVSGSSTCSIAYCPETEGVAVNFLNDARIENLIRVEASSGGNTIEDAPLGMIESGDAYAGVNVVNLANLNFFNSQYLLVALNAFGGLDGDIVFPNPLRFPPESASSSFAMQSASAADIQNDVLLDANSGGNEISDAASSTILTGDAHAVSNVFNQINVPALDASGIFILLRVHGDWQGIVSGAPSVALIDSGDGVYSLTGGWVSSSTQGVPHDWSKLSGTSTAVIHNDIGAFAFTGGNAIAGADTALISSGNAYAGVNLINIANANVVGRNWLLAVINIFGNWKGDIAFGRPDLWVGERVETPPPFANNGELTYRLTVINNGDAPASGIRLVDEYDKKYLQFLDSTLPFSINENGWPEWNLGELAPSLAIELSFRVKIINAPEGTDIKNVVLVRSNETDNNETDNRDFTLISTLRENPVIGSPISTSPPDSFAAVAATASTENVSYPKFSLEVTRKTSSSMVRSHATSTQEIIIRNPNDQKVAAVTFRDVLRDPSGVVLRSEEWDLGDVLPNEEISLGYEITFNEDAPGGAYFLSSTISRPDTIKSVFEANGMIFFERASLAPFALGYTLETEAVSEELLPPTTTIAPLAIKEPIQTILKSVAPPVAHAQSEPAYVTETQTALSVHANTTRDESRLFKAILRLMLLITLRSLL